MENVSTKRSFSDLTAKGCRSVVNPYSLLNFEMSLGKIHPLRWVVGLLFLSHFIIAFASIGNSYYVVTLFKFLLLVFVCFSVTCLVENLVICVYMNGGQYVSHLKWGKMLLFSLIIWTISIFLYLSIVIFV